MRTLQLKAGQPTLEVARRRLLDAMADSRRKGVRLMKVVHGWGSGGEGGVLAIGIRRSLRLRTREGVVVAFVPGERFSQDTEETRALLLKYPALRRDPDLNRANPGICVVELAPE